MYKGTVLATVNVIVNDHHIDYVQQQPYLSTQKVMIPFTQTFEKLKGTVIYNSKTHSVIGIKKGLTIKLFIGQNKVSGGIDMGWIDMGTELLSTYL